MASGTEIIRSIYKITHFDFLLDLVHDVKRIFICICVCDPENLLFWLYNVVTDQIVLDVGYDIEAINSCTSSSETKSAVVRQRIELEKTNIYGTPLVFINGKGLVGPKPFRVYERALKGWRFW